MDEKSRKAELEEFLATVCQNSAIYYQGPQMMFPSVKYLCGQGKIVYVEKSRMLDICKVEIPIYRGQKDDALINKLLSESEILMGCESHECLGSCYAYTISLKDGLEYH